MKKGLFFLFLFLIIGSFLFSQTFQQKTTSVSNLGLTISNFGTFGQPNIRNNPSGPPSMEYPLNSGIEHLFEGGIWIGALVDGQKRVSTSSLDATAGYYSGGAGFEFTALSSIEERSSIPSSEFFKSTAISHQDFVTRFTDSNVIIPGTSIPVSEHSFPLKAVVSMESYNYNFSFSDFFSILNYEVTNESTKEWDSVYFGIWTDLVVRNVNVTQDAGTAFYNKGGGGYLDSFTAIYAFQVYGDDYDFTQSYGALQFLGMEWRNIFFHPDNIKLLEDSGYTININANFWNFRKFDGSKYGTPGDDVERYVKMQKGLTFPDPVLQTAGNRTQLLSFGPIPKVKPGEKVVFAVALVCAKQLLYQQDNDEARAELYEHCNWAKRTYLGEDLNANGLLDPGEDLNNNATLDRYILPEPPAVPKLKIVASNQKIDLFWDEASLKSVDPISKKHDFEGFRLYRTKPGDDIDMNLTADLKLIAQWDSVGNDLGFNNGFSEIRLNQPRYFDDDTTAYWFHYSIDGMLNGWQYLFVLTAFDKGDKNLNLTSLESSRILNAYSVMPGVPADSTGENYPGVYPNPYSISSAWDGSTSRTKKIYFYNLPPRCEIYIYTLSGDLLRTLHHDASMYKGEDILWFQNLLASQNIVFSGGEHAWDLLSEKGLSVTQGLYLFSVKNLDDNSIRTGKFAVLK